MNASNNGVPELYAAHPNIITRNMLYKCGFNSPDEVAMVAAKYDRRTPIERRDAYIRIMRSVCH